MNQELLETAVTEHHDELMPILKSSYLLEPMPKYDVMQFATKVNESLGFTLFSEVYYPTLVKDFSIVTRAMQLHNVKTEV